MAREVRRWRWLAARIPDPTIRQDALDALSRKRGQTDGAALFSILPRHRSLSLLRLLVAYQILWDFLDSVGEKAPSLRNGRQLNGALVDALNPNKPLGHYYRHHPWKDDGGYLNALVMTCRACCLALPGFESVRKLVLREARRADVLALNHELVRERRVSMLRAWATREFPTEKAATWFELTGAASAGLTIFALLALASEQDCDPSDVLSTANAYFPWPGALATMLDSYVDQREDLANGDHVYISYYGTPTLAVCNTAALVRRTLESVRALAQPQKHVLIVASMVAMYLSKDSARQPDMRATTHEIAGAGGSLTLLLLPILRLWRTAYRLRSM